MGQYLGFLCEEQRFLNRSIEAAATRSEAPMKKASLEEFSQPRTQPSRMNPYGKKALCINNCLNCQARAIFSIGVYAKQLILLRAYGMPSLL